MLRAGSVHWVCACESLAVQTGSPAGTSAYPSIVPLRTVFQVGRSECSAIRVCSFLMGVR